MEICQIRTHQVSYLLKQCPGQRPVAAHEPWGVVWKFHGLEPSKELSFAHGLDLPGRSGPRLYILPRFVNSCISPSRVVRTVLGKSPCLDKALDNSNEMKLVEGSLH